MEQKMKPRTRMKKACSLVMALLLVLALRPLQKASAAETDEVCPYCGQTLSLGWGDNSSHYYYCSNFDCEIFNPAGYHPERNILEEHSRDGDCYCFVCGTYNHVTKFFDYDGVHTTPTCTEPGVDIDGECSHCVYCNQYFRLVYIDQPSEPILGTVTPALGHDWGEWQVMTEPEAGKAGERQRVCSRCNETETEPIAALIGYTVTYVVVNGTWEDGTATSKTEEVEDGQSPVQIPTGMIASEGFEGGAWDTDPSSATITGNTTFTYTFTAKQPPTPTKHTVTYAVVNGTWEDGTTTNKTEEVMDGQKPSQVPTGMKPAENYEGGAWDTDPSSATITDTASFTYTFKAKQNPPTSVTVTGIKLDSDSAKKIYTEGDALDVSGLTLEVSKSDGSKETVNVTAAMVNGFDSSKTGKQTLTVTYEGFTDTYEVEVKAKTDPPSPTYEASVQSVTWQKGSDKTLDLTIKRSEDDSLTFGKFASLKIDGKTVEARYYTTAAGSLKLSVKPEYLGTLSVGDHDVKVNFDDGSATVKLTVKAAASNPDTGANITSPKTGDESNLALWSCIMFLSLAGMIVLLLYTRKRKPEK